MFSKDHFYVMYPKCLERTVIFEIKMSYGRGQKMSKKVTHIIQMALIRKASESCICYLTLNPAPN